eukprot:2030924-Rhodomonas_salina.1
MGNVSKPEGAPKRKRRIIWRKVRRRKKHTPSEALPVRKGRLGNGTLGTSLETVASPPTPKPQP